MTLSAQRNLEILHSLADSTIDNGEKSRFIIVGSLARAALLGHPLSSLVDPNGKRFLDVDVIDRTNILRNKYTLHEGILDAQFTASMRPLTPESNEWGLFDMYDHESGEPFTTFPESSLGLKKLSFNSNRPESTIITPSAAAIIEISEKVLGFAGPLSKHRDQIATLTAMSEVPDPLLTDALDEYQEIMSQLYTRGFYKRARRAVYTALPQLAQSIQDGRIGQVIHHVRQSTTQPSEILTDADLHLPITKSPIDR